MCYMCHNSHILVKRKMKQNKTIHLKKRANPCFYAVILAFTTETSLERVWIHRMSVVLVPRGDDWAIMLAQVTPVHPK